MDLRVQLDVTSDDPVSGFVMDYIAGNSTITQRAVPYVPNAVLDVGDAHVGDNTLQGLEIRNVGDTVAEKAVGVTNIAPVAALNDLLTGGISTGGGVFAGSGDLGPGLAAGSSDNTGLTIGLDTSNAGMFADTATLSLFSSNEDMADLVLPGELVLLNAQVNNYANPVFAFESGDGVFSGSGFNYELNFGTLVQGSGIFDASLAIKNDVLGPADLLNGEFVTPLPTDFLLSGFNPFFDLTAGETFSGLSVSLDTTMLGEFSYYIVLNAQGHNTSGYNDFLDPITLAVSGKVAPIPVPGTFGLLITGLLAVATIGRRSVRR